MQDEDQDFDYLNDDEEYEEDYEDYEEDPRPQQNKENKVQKPAVVQATKQTPKENKPFDTNKNTFMTYCQEEYDE